MTGKLATQSKALAGAGAGFAADLGRHFLAGGSMSDVINSGERALELGLAIALGYAIVYLAPRNASSGT